MVEVGQSSIKNESHLVKHLGVLRTSRTESLNLVALGYLTNFGWSDDLDQLRRVAELVKNGQVTKMPLVITLG